MREPLLATQIEYRYGERSYQIVEDYEFRELKYFNSFLYENPLTEYIRGGWKVHISLDSSNVGHIALAWTVIIVPELIRCGIREFKITRENCLYELSERVLMVKKN
jgi:hypothetical protein